MSPTERGLWAAVLADPGDDLPRLIYADYLEENGRAQLAHFIRSQITLSQCPPGHPNYADAVEAQSLAVAAARGASSLPAPTLPDGATFAGSIREIESDNYGSYERGFASRVTFSGLRMGTGPGDLARALDRVIGETAVRGLDMNYLPEVACSELLHCHSATQVSRLGLTLRPQEMAASAAALRDGRGLHAVTRLSFGSWPHTHHFAPAILDNFCGEIAGAPVLRNLASFRLGFVDMLGPLREALSGALKSLAIVGLSLPGLRALEAVAASRLNGLRHLSFEFSRIDEPQVTRLHRLGLPPLSCLHLSDCVMPTDSVLTLLTGPYLSALTELAVLSPNGTSEIMPVVMSLTRPRFARGALRLLYLDNSVPDGDSLAELAAPGLFPALTTLSVKRASAPNDGAIARFAEAWRGETLHTLILDGWPAPAAALQKLAANPAFKSLRRLKLARCGVSDAGGVALARSPHLQNLVELDLSYNTLGEKSAALFLDNSVMPNLALADLTTNRMHPDTRTRLRASRVGMWA